MKVQAHSSEHSPLQYNQDHTTLTKSRFIMTLLTILGVTKILCSFRLVLEWKTGKEIPESPRLEFLKKFSANNFALSYAEESTSGPLNGGSITDLPFFENTISNSHKVPRTKFLGIDGLYCSVISICKFGSFKNPFTSLSERYFRFRRIILLVQTKKLIPMNYSSSTSNWKPWR